MDYANFDIKDFPHVSLRGGSNRFLTEGLFYEYGNPDALYTLKTEDVHKDGKTYYSMYRVYMASTDEYEAADKLLGSQQHWDRLKSAKFFMKGDPKHNYGYGLERWREDMRRRDESEAKRVLMAQTKDGNVNAAKALRETYKATKLVDNKKDTKSNVKQEEADIFSGFKRAKQGATYVN